MLLGLASALPALINCFLPWQHPFGVPGQSDCLHFQARETSSTPKRIAVVGAGTAGLSFLKVSQEYQREHNVNWEVVLYEQRYDIGGVWYAVSFLQGLHPMCQYHKDLVAHYNLTELIHLRHNVTVARWLGNVSHGHWELTIQKPRKIPSVTPQNPTRYRRWNPEHELETIYQKFDYLIVATGHNRYPHVDNFPGKGDWLSNSDPKSQFRRDIRHSMYFMGPQPYINRTVLIVGGGFSGMDIGNHLTPFVSKAYIARSAETTGDPSNHFLIPKPRLSHFDRDAIYFEDGSSVTDVDSVILATGYLYIIPFLSAGDALTVDPNAKSRNTSHIHPPPPLPLTSNGKYIRPLYKHTMSLSSYFPPSSLFVLGLQSGTPPALTDAAQAIFATRVIADPSLVAGRILLLRELEEEEERLRRAGYDPDKQGHSPVDFDGRGKASSNFMDGLIDFLKRRNVTGLPLPGSGGRYVEDWRRRHDNFPGLIRMFFTWREIEKRGEGGKMVAGRRTEEDWIELLDYLVAHPLPPTPI
ncbi:uncharacterized protein EI90DRAFT_3069318 [Cantharellus anzutake]|uniref:uncharacterized protein n=1 Tax=Cantharellus anzutake TaxID=1750568 RepID=UPI00190641AD|nr:uncharacterized protein EI90DRAFT_3069318 [Cantharellus anzutake]KAF8326865.1 hypothetical protein EI90DRAFT_3069318 [Cantharellus anzutake]